MKKIICLLTVFCVIFTCGETVYVSAEAAKTPRQEIGDVLLIYDEPDLVQVTESILTAFNRTVDKVAIDDYKKDEMLNYKYIVLLTPIPMQDISTDTKILCIGDNFDISGVSTIKNYGAGMEISTESFYQYLNYIEEFSVISEFDGESYGRIEMSFDRKYPFGTRTGNIYYVPYLSEDNISTFALGEILPVFFESSYQGGIYVIIKDVFAFSDLDMLCKTADELYLANIPFIVKVMPIYENTELDAFRRYTQVLRYVESRNGAVVMSPPLINGTATDEEIAELTQVATKALENEGVTVLPQIEGFYNVTMEYLISVKSEYKFYESFSFDLGIIENLPRSDLQLKQMVANLNGRWYDFNSYREKFDQKSKLFLETPLDEEIAQRIDIKETSLFYSVANNILTIFVSIMLLLILILIYLSRMHYKRKFTKNAG